MKKSRILIPALLIVLSVILATVATSSAAPHSAPTNPGTTDLISWWSLDETSGIRYDSHGSNHLSDNNTVGYGTGKISRAANFVAANSEFLSTSDNAGLSCDDENFSIGGWFLYDELDMFQFIASKRDNFNTSFEYEIFLYNGKLNIWIGNSSSTYNAVEEPILLSTNTWYFFLAQYDAAGNTISISINNGAAESASTSIDVVDTTATFKMGDQPDLNNAEYGGRIDEIFFYKRLLTTDEREWLYNSGNGRSYDDVNPPPTATPTETGAPTATETFTPTATFTFTPTATETFTPTATFTATPSETLTPSETPTETLTPTITFTPTITNTPGSETLTPTALPGLQLDETLTYGDYAIIATLAVIILILVIWGVIAFVLPAIDKRRNS